MVALSVPDVGAFDFTAFRAHLQANLPDYARPRFLRFQEHLETTSTFKLRKVDLVRDGFDPSRVADPIFVDDPRTSTFSRVDATVFADICEGRARV